MKRVQKIEQNIIDRYVYFAKMFGAKDPSFPYKFFDPSPKFGGDTHFEYEIDGEYSVVHFERGYTYIVAQSQNLDDVMYRIFANKIKNLARQAYISGDEIADGFTEWELLAEDIMQEKFPFWVEIFATELLPRTVVIKRKSHPSRKHKRMEN